MCVVFVGTISNVPEITTERELLVRVLDGTVTGPSHADIGGMNTTNATARTPLG